MQQGGEENQSSPEATQALAHIGSWVWIIDADGGLAVEMSPEIHRILGLAPGELEGKRENVRARIHPEDAARCSAEVDRTITDPRVGAPPYATVFRIVRPNGEVRWVQVEGTVVQRHPGGRPARITGALLDITERKTADEEIVLRQRQLVESERRFRTLVESSADVVCIINDRKYSYVSPAVRNVLGYEPEELIGQPTLGLVHPDDLIESARVREVFYETPPADSARLRTRILHKDGTYRLVDMVMRNFTEDPAIAGFVANFHDITERERALDDLRRSKATHEKAQALGRVGSWTIEGGSESIA